MSTARGDGALPEPVPTVRATDDDRMRTVARLRDAAGEGSIDLDELEQRIAATWEARTLAQLATVTDDLPAPVPPAGSGPVPGARRRPLVLEDDAFRSHFTMYALVIGMLVGIWLLSGGGHFWPFYPAAGWGIALGMHHRQALDHQRKRRARAQAEGISVEELDRRETDDRRARRRQRADRVVGALERSDRDAGSTRFVVAMFVDVVGSTTLNEAVGDEQWAAIRQSLRALVGRCIDSHGGWEANVSGDGVLARFEHPAAAADAAVSILRALEQQRGEAGFAPSVRVGIHSGDAVDDEGDIIGNVVNIAARVTDAAGVDEVLVTEHVADHLAHRHDTEGRGLHTLKGVTRPRHLLCLAWR